MGRDALCRHRHLLPERTAAVLTGSCGRICILAPSRWPRAVTQFGCGPGTVALLLSKLFEEVIGLDPDADMLREARRIASDRQISNASWVQLRAEELPHALGSFLVVTFAASFHWMDRLLVARTVKDMLDPEGVVVHDALPAEQSDPWSAKPGR